MISLSCLSFRPILHKQQTSAEELQPTTNHQQHQASEDQPQQLLEGVQIIFTGHEDTEDVPSDLGVHSLFPRQLQNLRTELETVSEKDCSVTTAGLLELFN